MRMATDAFLLTRRTWLAAFAAGMAMPAWTADARGFAATWESGEGGWRIGLLAAHEGTLAPRATLEVPTRAHGLLWQGRDLLAVARRPGDWMVRWRPGREPQWGWIEPDRAFNGHVIASPDGRKLYTTETDLESGAGLVGVRDAGSFEKLAEWRTGGMDPHELVLDADGTLLVANGGIPTLPETGRLKIGLERMDPSLVRMDTTGGRLRGQWRLTDPRLSVRHLAWCGEGPQRALGIALQAEHDDAAKKQQAPVLALFDGRALRAVEAPRALAGYGGDIAWAGDRIAVSCPRAGGVALFGSGGEWMRFESIAEACPLAADGTQLWAGGRTAVQDVAAAAPQYKLASGIRLDNHWLAG